MARTSPFAVLTWRLTALVLAGVLCGAWGADAADAARPWSKCSRTRGDAAARQAGLVAALNGDRRLRRLHGSRRPSGAYRRPSTSLCGDYDGDGVTDRAVHYRCCTVSSPAPWVVLNRRGPRWRIVFRRLHDTTIRLQGADTRLVTTEPRYAPTDPNCCPSQLRIGALRWTGTAFKRTFRIQDT